MGLPRFYVDPWIRQGERRAYAKDVTIVYWWILECKQGKDQGDTRVTVKRWSEGLKKKRLPTTFLKEERGEGCPLWTGISWIPPLSCSTASTMEHAIYSVPKIANVLEAIQRFHVLWCQLEIKDLSEMWEDQFNFPEAMTLPPPAPPHTDTQINVRIYVGFLRWLSWTSGSFPGKVMAICQIIEAGNSDYPQRFLLGSCGHSKGILEIFESKPHLI